MRVHLLFICTFKTIDCSFLQANTDQVAKNVFDFFVRELRVNEPAPVVLAPRSKPVPSVVVPAVDLDKSEPMQVVEDKSS